MKQFKIYFAGKFDFSISGEKLYQRLINDYRSTLLGNPKKLTFADNSAKLSDYPIKYNGCFYCERASNGDYTSTDCEVVVKEETKAIMDADIFCCVFDLDFSVGTIVELMDAAFAQKRIVIFYKNEESNYAIKSDYWFAITRALEICKSNHTTIEVFEYDENVLPSIYNWLNNLVFTKRYVCIRKAKIDEYLIGSKAKNQYSIGSKQVTCYEKQGRQFIVEFYENGLIMIKTADAIQNKGFVDVTYDELYTDMSIQNGKIIVSNAIIEGTDGVGKTETINQLVHHGIVCKDRSELICKYMLFGISMKDRCLAYKEYLEHSTDEFVVFLVNNSKKELDERISRRGKNISEFDKRAYEYNVLYEETYIEMLKYQLTNSIELVNCTGLSIEEQVNKVKDCVLRRINHE